MLSDNLRLFSQVNSVKISQRDGSVEYFNNSQTTTVKDKSDDGAIYNFQRQRIVWYSRWQAVQVLLLSACDSKCNETN